MASAPASPRATAAVAIAGALAVIAYAVAAAVQILVLNPLAAVPGAATAVASSLRRPQPEPGA